MKKIFKKNQVIVTALALMIAIAGYLNYNQSNLSKFNYDKEHVKEVAGEGDEVDPNAEKILQSDELLQSANDIESLDKDKIPEDETTENNTKDVAEEATDENDEANEDVAKNEEESKESTPGEAMLVSGISANTFAAQAKLNREQVRATNKEALQSIIDNANLADAVKQEAVDKMIQLTETSEKESAAETMLAAKGFANSVVTITDGKVDVAVGLAEISDSARAQIEDVVKRKTDVEVSSIYITPITE